MSCDGGEDPIEQSTRAHAPRVDEMNEIRECARDGRAVPGYASIRNPYRRGSPGALPTPQREARART